MYTVLLDQNWIIDFFRSIGYPIGPPSKLYDDNQVTIKRVLVDRITPRYIPLDFLITAINELHPIKKLKWWTQDQTCNLMTSIPNLMVEKSLLNLIDCNIGQFMIQITSILSKNNKSEIKKDKSIQCTQSY